MWRRNGFPRIFPFAHCFAPRPPVPQCRVDGRLFDDLFYEFFHGFRVQTPTTISAGGAEGSSRWRACGVLAAGAKNGPGVRLFQVAMVLDAVDHAMTRACEHPNFLSGFIQPLDPTIWFLVFGTYKFDSNPAKEQLLEIVGRCPQREQLPLHLDPRLPIE